MRTEEVDMTENERAEKLNDTDGKAVAMASLSMFESLLLALMEGGILDKKEVRGLLSDASSAHRQRAQTSDDGDLHLRIADVIEALRNGGNTTKPGDWLA
jgi:hypothetical protein